MAAPFIGLTGSKGLDRTFRERLGWKPGIVDLREPRHGGAIQSTVSLNGSRIQNLTSRELTVAKTRTLAEADTTDYHPTRTAPLLLLPTQ
jgi:hypothetical protein